MKRTNSRVIKLPSIVELGEELAAGLDPEEENARSYDYVRRTAIPTLRDYIIDPFSTAFKERAFNEAVGRVGLNSDGILNKRYSIKEVINGKKFAVTVYPLLRPSYEDILSGFEGFLDCVKSDTEAGVAREGVEKIDNAVYVLVEYLMNVMKRFRSENLIIYNKKDLAIKDPETNKKLPLDTEIEEMRVYLKPERYREINRKNADEYYDATSLESCLNLFLKTYEQRIMERYSIPSERLEKSQEFDYELSDGSGLRYFFFSKPSIKYGKIYSGLIGRKTKNITANTGDLDILKELAFEEPYEYIRGEAGVRVTTDEVGKIGKTKILRLSKDGTQEERMYSVFNSEDGVYVGVGDVSDTLEMLIQRHSSTPTQVKIDFFPAHPVYLR
jgi:hypothetical protein